MASLALEAFPNDTLAGSAADSLIA